MNRFWNIPNILTLIRFLLVPVYWVLFFTETTRIPALFVFITAVFTDLADGVIARKFNQITDYGKLLDPLADKLLQISALMTLVLAGRLAWPFAAIIAVKEVFLIICASVLLKRNVVISADYIGKIATVVMSIGIVLLMFDITLTLGRYVTAAGIGISVLAAINYTIVTLKKFNNNTTCSGNQEETDIKQ